MSKAWEVYDWPEGDLMERTPTHLVVVDGDGVMRAEVKLGASSMRVCLDWHKDGKPIKFVDAATVYPRLPKWVRVALNNRALARAGR